MADYRLRVLRSRRRTLAIGVPEPGLVVVRAPLHATDGEIAQALQKADGWIQTHLAARQERAAAGFSQGRFTEEELRAMAPRAAQIIPARAAYFAPRIGVTYGRITIRNQKSKWGSCSAQGNLNFNCLLSEAPPEVLDYVVVHELCHRKEMNHSPRFWAEVARVLPDYRARRQWLKTEGGKLISRMTGA